MGLSHAEKLLQSLGITEPMEIDLEAIAMDRGVRVKFKLLKGCEARILGVGDRAVITVDANSMPQRQRFSIGHELGHWCHHRGKSSDCRSEDIENKPSKYRNGVEKIADRFAADLLLPLYLFNPIARKFKKPNFDVITDLSQQFNASLTATAIRYVEHGLLPTMLVCYDRSGFRRWFVRNSVVPDSFFPTREIDKESEVFEIICENRNRTERLDCCADIWFDRPNADRFVLQEEAVRISQNEVLTLLTWDNEDMLVESEE